jgi:four helix bundle protein
MRSGIGARDSGLGARDSGLGSRGSACRAVARVVRPREGGGSGSRLACCLKTCCIAPNQWFAEKHRRNRKFDFSPRSQKVRCQNEPANDPQLQGLGSVAGRDGLGCHGFRDRGTTAFHSTVELASQIRRSATSVPSNVAEGHAHRGNRTHLRHVRIALGSLGELETQFELALRLEFIEAPGLGVAVGQVARTGQLLHGLERALKRRRLRNAISCLSLACGSVMTFVFVTLAILR